MAIGSKTKQHDIEDRPCRIETITAIERFELALIGGGRSVRSQSFGRDRMDIGAGNRRPRQQRLVHHAVIARGIVMRDEPFIAPEQMDARPREGIAMGRRGQHRVQAPRRRAGRQGKRESAGLRPRCRKQPARHALCNHLEIGQGLPDYPAIARHRRGHGDVAVTGVRLMKKRSTALAKPSSSLESVTKCACAFTSSLAFPIAMLSPLCANIATSLLPSPMVAISSGGTASCLASASSAAPLLASLWVTSR